MKRTMWIFIVLLVAVAGCATPNYPSNLAIKDSQKADFAEWTAKYGDSAESEIYYNIALIQGVMNNHAVVINRNRNATADVAAFVKYDPNETAQLPGKDGANE